MTPVLKKSISYFILVCVLTSAFLSAYSFPRKVDAFISTPSVGDATALDLPRYGDAIIESGIDKSIEKALGSYGFELNKHLSEVYIGNVDDYITQGLLPGKYTASVLEASLPYADPSISAGGYTAQDIVGVTAKFEKIPFVQADTSAQAIELGQTYARNAAVLQRELENLRKASNIIDRELRIQQISRQLQGPIQNVLMGAYASFTSSIACGGINSGAIRNAANYLATATTGIVANEIRASLGLGYYSQMARLGAPTANPNFWPLVFQAGAMETEGRARAAASLEILGPGLKASQNIPSPSNPPPPIKGYNSVAVQNAVSSFNIAQQTSWNSFAGSIKSYGTQVAYNFFAYDAYILASLAARHLAGLLKFIPFAGRAKSELAATLVLKAKAAVVTAFVSNFIIEGLIKKLQSKIVGVLFKGKIFNETRGCRQKTSTTDLAGAYDPNAVEIPGTSGSPADLIFFSVFPEKIVTQDELDAGVLIDWDASGVAVDPSDPQGLSVSLSPQPPGCSVGTNGSCQDFPQTTTIYTLTVTGPNVNTSLSKTVTVELVQPIDPALVTLSVEIVSSAPGAVDALVNWSIPADIPITSFTIDPLGDLVQSAASPPGGLPYTFTESVKVTLTLVDINGNVINRYVDVDVPPAEIIVPTPTPTPSTAGAFIRNFGVRE